MPNTPTLSTSAASGGVAGAVIVLIQWGLTFAHITLPADVAAALLVVIAPGLHWLAMKMSNQGVKP